MQSYLRKCSVMLKVKPEELAHLFTFHAVKIGKVQTILGADFSFFYACHSIPTIGFSVSVNGRSMYYSSDTMFDPPR